MTRQWIALAFAIALPSAMAFVYFIALGSNDASKSNIALQIAYPAAKTFQFSLPLVFLASVGPGRVLGSKRAATDRGLRFAVIAGAIVGSLIIIIAQLLRDSVLIDVPRRVAHRVAEFGTATPSRYLCLASFLTVVHSFLEEYYWRWFVFARLRQWMSFAPAAGLSSLGFAGHHIFVLDFFLSGQFWSATVPFTLGIAVGGAFWAWLFERSQSLMGPWISHVIVDAAIMAVGYKMVFLS